MPPVPESNRRILIIDDTASIHEDFRKILAVPAHAATADIRDLEAALFDDAPVQEVQAAVFQLDSAYQGREARDRVAAALAAGAPYAVAFVDMRMPPGWDGLETIEQLWLVDPDLQIVICSAYSDYSWADFRARLGERDALLILKKPFDTIEVIQCAHALSAKWNLARFQRAHVGSLEIAVRERTAALDARTTEMRLVFDHVDQGLFVVDLDGTMACERSGAVERWLGPVPASRMLVDYIRGFAPDSADWFAVMWSALADGVLPLELCIAQLPTRFTINDRQLEWSYSPFVAASGATRILAVISDVTAELERQRAERDERETTSLLSRMLRDRQGFIAGYEEAERLVAEIASDSTAADVFHRSVHTLKGIGGMLELGSIADACHALEDAEAEADADAALIRRAAIVARWRYFTDILAPLLEGAAGRLDVVESDLLQLETAIAQRAPHVELARVVKGWHDERVVQPLARLAELARAMATRLGKAPITVHLEADPRLRLPATWAPLWSGLVHAVRNAIDHGVESSAERLAAGKPEAGEITLRAASDDAGIVIELTDDGRGIQWEHVAEAARARGLPAASPADLEEALFQDGVSTRGSITEISGRGIGMGALRHACEQTGGRIVVRTSSAGTTFRLSWPAAQRMSTAA